MRVLICYCCTPLSHTHVSRVHPSSRTSLVIHRIVRLVPHFVHTSLVLIRLPTGPAHEVERLLRSRSPTPTHSVPHHVRKYPEYCPMASQWPKLELWSAGPLIGDPDRIHALYPGDEFSRPLPDFPPLATLLSCACYLALHKWNRAEPVGRMVCSRSFVGWMSWITLKQLTLMASFAQVAWRFDHTRSLSVVGYSSVMRTFLGGAAANLICVMSRTLPS